MRRLKMYAGWHTQTDMEYATILTIQELCKNIGPCVKKIGGTRIFVFLIIGARGP